MCCALWARAALEDHLPVAWAAAAGRHRGCTQSLVDLRKQVGQEVPALGHGLRVHTRDEYAPPWVGALMTWPWFPVTLSKHTLNLGLALRRGLWNEV